MILAAVTIYPPYKNKSAGKQNMQRFKITRRTHASFVPFRDANALRSSSILCTSRLCEGLLQASKFGTFSSDLSDTSLWLDRVRAFLYRDVTGSLPMAVVVPLISWRVVCIAACLLPVSGCYGCRPEAGAWAWAGQGVVQTSPLDDWIHIQRQVTPGLNKRSVFSPSLCSLACSIHRQLSG